MWFRLTYVVSIFIIYLNLHPLVSLKDGGYNDESVLDICAFNVRIFGTNKVADKKVMRNLVKILLRYDLILVQEIRDSSGVAIQSLLRELNHEFTKGKKPSQRSSYKMLLSPRLGRTTSKEEYAFIYRADLLTVQDFFTYDDKNDVFEREPFVAKFHCSVAAVKDFAIAGIHTSPRDASNEISNLTNVYESVRNKWKLDDVIIMGDFNAGCSYVKDWKRVSLAKDDRFYWIIDNSLDTTAEKSDCPYDRIVVAGNDMVRNILPNSGGAFYFDEEMNLSSAEALLISDHYPVHMQIRFQEESQYNWISKSFIAYDSRVNQALVNKPHLVYGLRGNAKLSSNFIVSENFKRTGAYNEIIIQTTANDFSQAQSQLHALQVTFPKFVSLNQVKMVKRFMKNTLNQSKLRHGHGRYKTLYDYYKNQPIEYRLKLLCSLEDRNLPSCSLHLIVLRK